MSLDQFIGKIKDFEILSASLKIDYFMYYLTIVNKAEGARPKDIELCFDQLKIRKYSNTSSYLRNNSKKIKGKSPKFIFHNGLYHLERQNKIQIDSIIGTPQKIDPTNNYFPLELFANTRGYLESIAIQTAACYDNGLFDACSVMTRKLLEVLIIEAFERHNIASKIKDNNDNFFFLSDLFEYKSR